MPIVAQKLSSEAPDKMDQWQPEARAAKPALWATSHPPAPPKVGIL